MGATVHGETGTAPRHGGHQPRGWDPRFFRRHPEWLFVPLAAVMVAFGLAPSPLQSEWGAKFLTYLSSPAHPVIFPVTWTASWASFGVIAVLSWRWAGLHPLRAVCLGAAIPFGATGGFEIVYQLVGDRVQPWGFGMSVIAWVALVLWTLPGVATAPWWKVGRPFWALLAMEAIGFGAWVAIGYPQVTWGSPAEQPLAYGFNILLKVGAFLLVAVPTYEGVREVRAERTPPTRPRADLPPSDETEVRPGLFVRPEPTGPADTGGGAPRPPGSRVTPALPPETHPPGTVRYGGAGPP